MVKPSSTIDSNSAGREMIDHKASAVSPMLTMIRMIFPGLKWVGKVPVSRFVLKKSW
jgi:hypothetical protein